MDSRRNTRDISAYRRPVQQTPPAWAQDSGQDAWQPGYGQAGWGQQEAAYPQPYDEEAADGEAPYAEGYEEQPPYDGYDPPYEEPYDESYDDGYGPDRARRHSLEEEPPQVIATNSTVKLTCTLAAMMSLFALFLCFAEKKSNAIRHFSRQSVGLAAVHLALAAVLLVVSTLLGVIPFLGFLVNLVCWLVYIAVLIAAVWLRVRMMLFAWRGLKFTLPVIGKRLERMR